MVSRAFPNKTKERLFVLFIVIVLAINVIYLCFDHFQYIYKNAQWSGERCLSELNTVKYQLNEYKKKIDKLLIETQRAYESDKQRFKDVMESCVAMKQQSSICQSQFEDLQSECKKVKKSFDETLEELNKIKN